MEEEAGPPQGMDDVPEVNKLQNAAMLSMAEKILAMDRKMAAMEATLPRPSTIESIFSRLSMCEDTVSRTSSRNEEMGFRNEAMAEAVGRVSSQMEPIAQALTSSMGESRGGAEVSVGVTLTQTLNQCAQLLQPHLRYYPLVS